MRLASRSIVETILFCSIHRSGASCENHRRLFVSISLVELGQFGRAIALEGKPEFAAADGAGCVFVNIEDKSTLAKIDAKKMTVLEQWPLAPGATPASLAMDPKSKRLFVGCRNKMLAVVNAENGKVVAHAPIGQGADATAFDPATGNIFVSCGDGTLTVVHADGEDKFSVAATIKTKPRSKTMALDLKTHKLFLPSADFKSGDAPKSRPTIVPSSFAVLVFGNEK